jgi:ubiquinone/menaquinone biosynthesis C-methylase UbiE
VEANVHRWVQRHGWDRAAGHYERFWGRQLQPATDLVLRTADLQPGERVVDVACGSGAVAVPAALAVGPTGRVLATDLSPVMVAALGERLARCALSNVAVEVQGAEDFDRDSEFDVALCSLGLMYMPRPDLAARALARALRPGGRVVLAVWGERHRCGWAEIFPIVDAHVSSDVCPMFFGLGARGALRALLADTGFVDVRDERLDVELVYVSEEDALGAAFAGGPVALAWSRFDDEARRSAADEYLSSIAEFADGTSYRVPGQFVVAAGRRPG